MRARVVCPATSCARPRRLYAPLSSATHPKVARNLTRSFFDIAHKRCNSNDSISIFEIIARELRATLLRNYGTTTAGIWRMQDADARRGHIVRPAVSSIRSLSWGTRPKVARNLTRSFFDIAHKRCNSNDSISMFEIIARELRATLLRNHSVEPQSRGAAEPQNNGGVRRVANTPDGRHHDQLLLGQRALLATHPPAAAGQADQARGHREVGVDATGASLG